MNDIKKTPAIRFKGFSDAWEQYKFDELYTYASEGGTPDTNNKSYYANPKIPFIKIEDTENKYITHTKSYINEEGMKNSSAWLLPANNVIFTNGATVGNVSINKIPVTTKQGILGIVPSHIITTELMYYLLSTILFQREVKSRMATGTFATIILKNLNEIQVTIPKSKIEQERISSMLDRIDSLITLHQRKHEKLQQVKKALLDKMFPKEGEVAPKIRFKGFKGAWEQCELGVIADIIGGGTPSTAVSNYWDGDIDWYSPVEIGDKIYVDGSQNKITKLGLENSSAKILAVGTVLFTSRAGIGKVAILFKQGSTNQGFQSILPKQGRLNTYFIYSRSEELKRYSETVGAGSTFIEVSGKQLAKMPIKVPDIEEQKKIGAYFEKIDNLITLHQREYEKLQNIKKALLQKMFV